MSAKALAAVCERIGATQMNMPVPLTTQERTDLKAAGYLLLAQVRTIEELRVSIESLDRCVAWTCKARRTADPPEDCDWPNCGCDPYADKVLAALEEQAPGLFGVMRDNEVLKAKLAAAEATQTALQAEREQIVTDRNHAVHRQAMLETQVAELEATQTAQAHQLAEIIRRIPASDLEAWGILDVLAAGHASTAGQDQEGT